jgi:outer membrane protein assembly factor BamB
MAAIERGEVSAEPPVTDEPVTRPARPRSRPLRVGVLLLLLLATMAGGAPAARPLPEAGVPARLGATVFATGGRLLVADPVHIGEDGQWLTAYRLPGGERLWRVPLPLRGNVGPWAVSDGTLLMSAEWGSVIPPETVALDLVTGTERWRRVAWLEGVTSTGDVMLWTSQPGDWAEGAERPGTLRAVARETGSERWSLPLAAGAIRAYQRDDGWVWGESPLRLAVIALPDGEIQVRDLGTGQVRRAVRPPAPRSGRWYVVEVTDDLLVLNSRAVEAVVYGLADLTPRWKVTRGTSPREFGPLPCAELLCLYGETGGLRAFDPVTGSVRWSDQRWGVPLAVDGRLVAAEAKGSASRARPLTVLDPATGEVLGDLGTWEVIGRAQRGGLVAVRPGPDGRIWVARLDVRKRTTHLLGRLAEVSGECQTAAGALFCRQMNGSIGTWRLPSG